MGKKGSIRYRAREQLGLKTGPEGCHLFKVKLVVSRQDLYLELVLCCSSLVTPGSWSTLPSHSFPSTSWILKEQTPGS